jgi:hypothetical protein
MVMDKALGRSREGLQALKASRTPLSLDARLLRMFVRRTLKPHLVYQKMNICI